MTESNMPSMETLAPLVDNLQAIAREEIPAPRTGLIRLYDDYTYRITIKHRHGDHREGIVYDRVTGEVYWRDTAGQSVMYFTDPVDHHTISLPYFRDDAQEVVATVEPPIECERTPRDCETEETVASFPLRDRS